MGGALDASQLPLEIVDAITAYLRDDPAALQACSLLCPTWTVSARRRIFETTCFHIDGPEDAAEDPPYGERLHGFHVFLEHTPYICGAVRQLELGCVNPQDEDVDYQVSLRALFPVLQKLTALRTLVLQSVLWSALPRRPAAFACPSVTQLVVKDAGGPTCDWGQVAAIFHLLPGLADLSAVDWQLEWLEQMDLEEPGHIPLPAGLQLKSLTINNALSACFLASVSRTMSAHTLRSLEIETRSVMFRDLARMGALLKAAGPTLRHLKLAVWCCPHQDRARDPVYMRRMWADLQVSACTALQTLYLEPDFSIPSPWLPAQAVLSAVPGRDLRRLTICIPPDCFTRPSRYVHPEHVGPNWDELHSTLLRFTALKTVHFVCQEFRDEPIRNSTQKYIQRKLAFLQEKGILRFD